MRKRFSERNGHKQVDKVLQIESIDIELKNRIWNQIQKYYFDRINVDLDASISPSSIKRYMGGRNSIEVRGEKFNQIEYDSDYEFFQNIYDRFFKMNHKPSSFLNDVNIEINQEYNNMPWYVVYDFIEYISEVYSLEDINNEFRKEINIVLEEEMSGYRFVNNLITPIIDEVEIQEIEETLDIEYNGAKRHLSNALELLSDRENPDYQNSIKESISAVESIARIISDKPNASLSNCLQHYIPFEMDKNFKGAMIKMYSWTSSVEGIRHGSTEEELKTSFDEAKYMLVTCSAFVNYLISKKG